ncbi:MAG: arylformamidase [Clostridia bacterium]|nr:arylformamidase [Clostridia bacterium]
MLYDVSMPIYPGMPVYKNRPEKQPRFEVARDYDRGLRETKITLDAHTGTHIDAPLHISKSGRGVDGLDLQGLIGPCRVLDLTHVDEKIEPAHLSEVDVQPGDFILFKTKNSWQEEFNFQFIYLTKEAAQYLAEKGVRGIGIDALGIERDQPDYGTHGALLERGVVIIEGLRLKEVNAGRYYLIAAPLPLVGVEAAPARVVLVKAADNNWFYPIRFH